MKLSDLSIRRPIFASMVSLALILFGVIGYTRLAVREFPDVDPPIISVRTELPGANPQVVESAVTDILEEELSTVEGLRTLTSGSAEGFSNITLEFNLDRAVEAAAQDVRDKVARVRGRLPEDVREPVVAKQEADAQPFFWLALSGENYGLLQLSDVGDRLVKSRLQTLPGVGQARIFGERRFSMRVWLSASELSARGLTVQDVQQAIRSRNVEVPAGRIESERREFTVRSLGELKTADEFANLVVSNSDGILVKLKDLGRVELGPEDERSALRFKGTPAVAIGVVRQSKSNIIQVADAIRHELPRIQESLPAGVRLSVAFDQSIFVSRSIREAEETLVLAAFLVVVIIFVFLRNLRATLIPGLAIPTSIVATFAIMYFLGFSINNFTLLALTLAIGIVVDDAIIVLENAYRHQEELGESPEEAATNGTREIAFAVIATTISLVAVFTPLAFLKGSTGRLFNEFGIAVAGAVVVSGFVALTLTPMLCAKILRVPQRHGALYRMLERGFNALASGYARTLRAAIRHRWAVVGGVVLLTAGAGVVFRSLKREFVPPEDKGWFFSIIIAPEGSSLAYTDGYQRQAEAVLSQTKDVASYFSVVNIGGGVSRGMIFTNLVDFAQRTRPIEEIIGQVQGGYFGIPGVLAFANNPPAFGFGSPVQFVIQNPDFDLLVRGNDTLLARARQVKGLLNVDSDLRVNKPELTVRFDRDRAEDLGVSVGDVATTLQVLLGGNRTSTFTRNNKQYDVIVQLDPRARATPSDMTGLYVRGRDGQLVKLEALASVAGRHRSARAEPLQPGARLDHHRQPGAGLHPGRGPGLARSGSRTRCCRRAAAPRWPASRASWTRAARRSTSPSCSRLLVVFMVLASQFESLIHPFTVLLAVPLAVTGALFTLKLANATHQSVQPDRDDPADRPGDQELHPAGGIHQPAQGARDGHRGRGARGRPDPAPADPHDLGLDGHGRHADRARPRRRLHQPAAAGLRHRGRGAVLDGAHPLRGAGGLPDLRRPPRAGPRPGPDRPPAPGRRRRPSDRRPPARRPGRRGDARGLRAAAHARQAIARASPARSELRPGARPGGQRGVGPPGRAGGVRAALDRRSDSTTPGTRPSSSTSATGRNPTSSRRRHACRRGTSCSAAAQVRRARPHPGRARERRGRRAASSASAPRWRPRPTTTTCWQNQELAGVAADRARRAEEGLGVARARVVAGRGGADRFAAAAAGADPGTQSTCSGATPRCASPACSWDGGSARTGRWTRPRWTPPTCPTCRWRCDEAVRLAVGQGPQYRAARANERAAAAFLQGERGQYLPQISLVGTHLRFDDSFFPSARNVNSLTLTVSLPIWDNGRREIAVSQARVNRDVARAIREDLERAARRDVTQAYEAYVTAQATTALSRTGVVVARENYRVQEKRYRAGATTILDLLDAQIRLTQSEADLVQARYAARLALAGLEAILGHRLFTNRDVP